VVIVPLIDLEIPQPQREQAHHEQQADLEQDQPLLEFPQLVVLCAAPCAHAAPVNVLLHQ
jgi:hypothetical protein